MIVLEELLLTFNCDLNIEKAHNGKEALEMIEKKNERDGRVYDMILIDLTMPVMSGEEFIVELRNREDN